MKRKRLRDCAGTGDEGCRQTIPKGDRRTINDLPENDLKDIFRWCNLPARCRFRRVCRYWKYIISMKELNIVMFLNNRCLLVSQTIRRNPARGLQTNLKPQKHPHMLGLWKYSRFDRGRVANLTDLQRNGLMGPHVRVLIFEGTWPRMVAFPSSQRKKSRHRRLSCALILRSIGMYCRNVDHIVLSGSYFTSDFNDFTRGRWTSRQQWLSDDDAEPSGFPGLISVRLVNCRLALHDATMIPWETSDDLQAEINITNLTLDWSADPDGLALMDLERFVWPDPTEQRAWVAVRAPLLPPKYHAWFAFGSFFLRRLHTCLTGSHFDSQVNLLTLDYTSIPVSLVLLLMSCILGITGETPLPYPFTRIGHPKKAGCEL